MKKKIISIALMIIVILGVNKLVYADNQPTWYKYKGNNGWYYYTNENGNTDTVYWVKVETNGNRTVAKLTFNEKTWKYEYKGTDELKYVIEDVNRGTLEGSGTEATPEYYFKLKAIMMNQSSNSVTMTEDEYNNFTEEDKENREFAYDYWENQRKQQEQQQVNLKEINLDQIVTDANDFLNKGSETDEDSTMTGEQIQDLSNMIYNVLFVIGIIIAVIIGGILGIQFITSGAEGKADVKQMLVPYIIGLVVLFGAFTIWKIVLITLQGS